VRVCSSRHWLTLIQELSLATLLRDTFPSKTNWDQGFLPPSWVLETREQDRSLLLVLTDFYFASSEAAKAVHVAAVFELPVDPSLASAATQFWWLRFLLQASFYRRFRMPKVSLGVGRLTLRSLAADGCRLPVKRLTSYSVAACNQHAQPDSVTKGKFLQFWTGRLSQHHLCPHGTALRRIKQKLVVYDWQVVGSLSNPSGCHSGNLDAAGFTVLRVTFHWLALEFPPGTISLLENS